MKHSTFCRALAVAGMLLTAGAVRAVADDSARAADHAALRVLMTNTTQAINAGDLDKLNGCFAKEFVFTAVDQTVLTNAASVKTYFDAMVKTKGSPVSSFKMTPSADILTRFIGDNAGYCYGQSDDEYTIRRNKRHIVIHSRWTALVVKEDGQWKIAAVHAGVDFLDNPVLKARSMSLWRKLLLGLGIGRYPGEK